jgi:type II secretory pathway pseudopilin PulG
MPEGPEIDTDNLRETIDEEIEKDGGTLLRTVALTTAVFAALAAIASLQAGGTVNEALVLKTEATRLQAEASDQWAYYQAKGLKATVTELSKNSWAAIDKAPPDELAKSQERYLDDQRKSKEKAEELEKQRDEKSTEADQLMHHHHFFAQSVALLQVSIALGAVAALTRKRLVWVGSALLGLIGVGVFAWAQFG